MANRTLIAYFSRPGENYVGGKIVPLETGNTQVAAEWIAEKTGGTLYRILPARAYPADYRETTRIAQEELRANARPALAGAPLDPAPYDRAILAYPNWWGTLPMAVCAFLEKYDFSGKTLAPICTHEGSGLGRSERDIARLCPGATLLEGLAVRGGGVYAAAGEIERWLKRNGLM